MNLNDPSFFQFQQTYRNCCGFPHWICSTVICATSLVLSSTVFILSAFFPTVMVYLYKVTVDETKALVCGIIISLILITFGIIFAIGIAKDWPLFILLWLVVYTLIWNLHLILFLYSFTFYVIAGAKDRHVLGPLRLFMIFLVQVLWMVAIVMVGQHWYALCEDFYVFEHGTNARGQSNRRRIMAQSVRLWM